MMRSRWEVGNPRIVQKFHKGDLEKRKHAKPKKHSFRLRKLFPDSFRQTGARPKFGCMQQRRIITRGSLGMPFYNRIKIKMPRNPGSPDRWQR